MQSQKCLFSTQEQLSPLWVGEGEGKVKAMKLKPSWFLAPCFPVLCIHGSNN